MKAYKLVNICVKAYRQIHRFTGFLDCAIIGTANRLPPRFRLMNNNRQLKILQVCKTCSDGTSDLQVIQCNASNPHGYAFSNAYVNVLGHYHFLHALYTFYWLFVWAAEGKEGLSFASVLCLFFASC